jgi:G patch domain and KOW motifs-containing protein
VPSSSSSKPKQFWLREGIRVKIVSKSLAGGKAYLQKGAVRAVLTRGSATVLLDSGLLLEGVAERHAETVVPGVGEACVVLHGEYKGLVATVMQKHRETLRVVVQLVEELDVVELDMDSIAALATR